MIRHLLVSTILGAALTAQTPPCISLNDANTNVSTAITAAALAGPTSWGYQITPAQTTVLMALQIYTGNTVMTPGFLSLEVYDENPATNLPGTRLGGGTWRIAPNLGVEWQGCNLDQIVVLTQSTNYWLVWTEPGGSRLPYEPGGTVLPFARRIGTGAWAAQATQQALKYRGFCSLLDSANVVPAGFGCPLASGALPVLFTNQQPQIANGDFRLEASGMPPNTLAVFVVGWDPTFVSLPVAGLGAACQQHTDILASRFGTTGAGNVRATIAVGAFGHAGFDFPIPGDPVFVGQFFGTQVAVFDPALTTPIPFALTNGVRFTIY